MKYSKLVKRLFNDSVQKLPATTDFEVYHLSKEMNMIMSGSQFLK